MKNFFTISILFIFFINCKKKTEPSKVDKNNVTHSLVNKFENELNELNNQDVSLIDDATKLFQKYIGKTDNEKQRDSLFQPYFNIYMSAREFLKNEEKKQLVDKYGFIKKIINGKEYLNPSRSEYLQTNIIDHLSITMQKFCNQQLKEFNDIENLETIGTNVIWWERFNKENSLSKKALQIYYNILRDSPNTETAITLKKYLNLLKVHNMIRTDEINEFIKKQTS